MTYGIAPGDGDSGASEPAVIVSCDSHAGPRLRQQLRDYCPGKYLGDFDVFADRWDAQQAALAQTSAPRTDDLDTSFLAGHPNLSIPGHYEPKARLRDMDFDGVAAEVIFHFSQNGEPLPFVYGPAGGLNATAADEFELAAVGYHIYNEWLADFVSAAPDRLVGLAYLPTWDIEATVKELTWARNAGLRAVNFPPPSRVGHLEYNNPAWEPFWSACEDLGMALTTHSSGAAPFDYFSGPGGQDLVVYECGGWMARRAVWWLVHGRVFERHPDLKLVITEQYEGWWTSTLNELDQVYVRFGSHRSGMEKLPKMPSEYVRSNVFIGASFLSTYMAEDACQEGYAANILWGRDYPHVEGSFLYSEDPSSESITRLALRHVFSRVPRREALMMAGENAVEVFGLDRAALVDVASRIGAPTGDELVTAPGELPPVPSMSNAFRGQAGTRPVDHAIV
jgi:predicted TIM-barrel fold metal-dependent hydrolase